MSLVIAAFQDGVLGQRPDLFDQFHKILKQDDLEKATKSMNIITELSADTLDWLRAERYFNKYARVACVSQYYLTGVAFCLNIIMLSASTRLYL